MIQFLQYSGAVLLFLSPFILSAINNRMFVTERATYPRQSGHGFAWFCTFIIFMAGFIFWPFWIIAVICTLGLMSASR